MLAAAITLSLFAFVLIMIVDVIRRDGRKIIAALGGRSLATEPMVARQITIRFSGQRRATEIRQFQPVLRAAA